MPLNLLLHQHTRSYSMVHLCCPTFIEVLKKVTKSIRLTSQHKLSWKDPCIDLIHSRLKSNKLTIFLGPTSTMGPTFTFVSISLMYYSEYALCKNFLLWWLLKYNYIILENYLKLIMIDSKLSYKFTCNIPKVKGIIIFIFFNSSI